MVWFLLTWDVIKISHCLNLCLHESKAWCLISSFEKSPLIFPCKNNSPYDTTQHICLQQFCLRLPHYWTQEKGSNFFYRALYLVYVKLQNNHGVDAVQLKASSAYKAKRQVNFNFYYLLFVWCIMYILCVSLVMGQILKTKQQIKTIFLVFCFVLLCYY